ncbi:serine/threonine protein kinase [Tolypothrix tenuis PCC 7101]|uniref:non-specific serine/threonine protein kinase n=1 Tax=Tolypothrix tenuis PCC 7101 TaxID=231146 RepID=A0A1Z4MSU1_9CYAN|nr:protein kinase [Aulosira sp. FACHB-113]BAY96545.1 serine/threonine protein kinase [Tolypothrix tenuis PCC 7101]BAZ72948.1 serine/threonine protein kinase [Aulosira laxa NIES-50]
MISYPDFSEHGYQVIRELGRNREGGRITWLALKIDSQEQVVVKQFCFAQFGSSWSGFEAHQREIEVLEKLAHPGIPRYIDSFSICDGFCLVQEYIKAENLAELIGHFELEEIKQIAIQVLEILVYLQNLKPGVIHRDIKPENILVDEECNVYLIDFGFARIGSQEVAGSSVFKGTPGFIPPEQMFEPTKATDLYALGATLICLLTEIRSTEIRELCDRNNPYQIQFQNRLPQLSLSFIGWLEKMVQPLQKDRFSTAKEALAGLKPIDVIRVAGVDFSETVLEFKANRLGEKLTQSITVENPIADTLLQGRWEVAPHPHDPPHTPDDHAWIAVTPAQFSGNHTQCQVLVDTSKLMADKQYKRQLILHSNAYPQTHTLTVKVQTAALPIEKRKIPFGSLIGLFVVAVVVAMATTWFITNAGYGWILFVGICSLMLVFGSGYSARKQGNSVGEAVVEAVGRAAAVVGFCVGSFAGSFAGSAVGWAGGVVGLYVGGTVGLFVGLFVGGAVGNAVDWVINLAEDSFTTVLILLTLGFGASAGTGIIAGFLNPFILLALTGTSLPALSMLLYSPLKTRNLITKYRDSEEYLIKP